MVVFMKMYILLKKKEREQFGSFYKQNIFLEMIGGFYYNKHNIFFLERVDSFYKNKTEYLLREIKYLLGERISSARERELWWLL